MTLFRGKLTDAFENTDLGTVLSLTAIEGTPSEGKRITIGEVQRTILAVGVNSTDGQPVSTRSCLTGKSVPAYGALLVATMPDKPVHDTWVEEINHV